MPASLGPAARHHDVIDRRDREPVEAARQRSSGVVWARADHTKPCAGSWEAPSRSLSGLAPREVFDQPDRAGRVGATDALAQRVGGQRYDVRPDDAEADATPVAAGGHDQGNAKAAARRPAPPPDRRLTGGRPGRGNANEHAGEAAVEQVHAAEHPGAARCFVDGCPLPAPVGARLEREGAPVVVVVGAPVANHGPPTALGADRAVGAPGRDRNRAASLLAAEAEGAGRDPRSRLREDEMEPVATRPVLDEPGPAPALVA